MLLDKNHMVQYYILMAAVLFLNISVVEHAYAKTRISPTAFTDAAKEVLTTDAKKLIKSLFQLPVDPDDVDISNFTQARRVVKMGKYIHRGDHWGIDFSSRGQTDVAVNASLDGIVVGVQSGCPNGKRRRCGRGFGNFIKIQHPDGTTTMYAHLAEKCMSESKVGLKVKTGQKIGCIGNSGKSSGFHLCFRAMNADGKPMLPELLLGSALALVDRQKSAKVPQHLAAIKKVITDEGVR